MVKEANQRQQNRPPFAGNQQIYSSDSEDDCFENLRNYPFDQVEQTQLQRRSLEPISNCSFGESEVDFGLNSPSSKYHSSSLSGQKQKASNREEDEANSPIETSSDDRRETCEPNDIDEAIAWAKKKFQTICSETSTGSIRGSDLEKQTEETLSRSSLSDGDADSLGSRKNKTGTEEESTKQLQILDEKRRAWSTDYMTQQWLVRNISNESNPKITSEESLSESAFELHPDKLQLRDATLAQNTSPRWRSPFFRMLGLHLSHYKSTSRS